MAYRRPILTEIALAAFPREGGQIDASSVVTAAPQLKDLGFQDLELTAIADPAFGPIPLVRYWSADRTRLVQVSRDRISVNHLVALGQGYLGWNSFRALFDSVFDIFFAGSRPLGAAPHRLELVTIDTTEFQCSPDTVAAAYFNFDGQVLPAQLGNSTQAVDVRWSTQQPNAHSVRTASHLLILRPPHRFSVRLHSQFLLETRSLDAARSGIAQLHDCSSLHFEQLITNRLRDEVMHGRAT